MPDDGQNIPFPKQNNSQKYQANIEKNSDALKITEEIIEYYDGVDNIGISINYYDGQKVSEYSYYKTNELIIVKGKISFTKIIIKIHKIIFFLIYRLRM